MKEYELTILVHPDLERDVEPVFGNIRKMITDVKGKIISEDKSDKKRLAYEIDGQDSAIYLYIEAELPPEGLQKLAATFNITHEIIRHLVVLKDDESSAVASAKLATMDKEKEEK